MTRLGLLILLGGLLGCRKDKPSQEPLPVLGTCQAVTESGCLSTTSVRGVFTYTTAGGGEIIVDIGGQSFPSVLMRHRGYPGFTLSFGGRFVQRTPRFFAEHLNDRHIKNKQHNNRTIYFPDGAKITLVSEGIDGPTKSLRIYDGTQVHHLNLTCGVLEFSGVVSVDVVRRMDEAEADGEAGGFEITETGLLFFNLYTEDQPGRIIENRYNLGELHRNEPKKVTDYYDDPNLSHT